ncbi:hypothetical protein BC826DRAFT_1059799 [Russula brevipes]|nr:hypothetical protein BC826DRAFT_1059799 [Russula brevipes]
MADRNTILLATPEGLIIMFLIPMAVTLSIAATRMHLSLVHFIYGSSEIAPNSLQGCGTPVSKVTATPPTQTSLNQTEVVVHRECFQLSTFETSHDGSYTGEDGKGRPGPKDLV